MTGLFKILVAGAAFGAFATSASAASLISNGSFEGGAGANTSTQDTELGVGSTAMPSWTVINAQTSLIGPANPYFLGASDGSYFLDLTSLNDNGNFGGVKQSITTIVGHTYLLTFDLGSATRYGSSVGVTASAGSTSGNFLSSGTVPATPGYVWEGQSLAFTASSTSTLVSLFGTSGRQYIGLDNVAVADTGVAAVPEPGTWGMMLAGFGMIGFAARRRRAINTTVRFA